LFRAGDQASLVKAILMLLQYPDEWPRMQSAGREFVERERNWPASVARYKAVYERLIKSPGDEAAQGRFCS
jgi:glycosyltransferase involved in cell wall biosynthesis